MAPPPVVGHTSPSDQPGIVARIASTDEQLVLHAGGSDRVLARQRTNRTTALPTQRLFLASPDGTHLAYADSQTGRLVVLDCCGGEIAVRNVFGQDARFSPDGRRLAAITTDLADPSEHPIVVVDIETGTRTVAGRLAGADWIEWVRAGLVVHHAVTGGRTEALTFLGSGTAREIARAVRIDRFTTANRGDRVVYFTPGGLFSVDLSRAGTAPRRLGDAQGVANAEATPDGRRVAFATTAGLWVIDGDAAPRFVAAVPAIHSIWFSGDGQQLAYASPAGAHVLAGGRDHRLDAFRGDLMGMRFDRGTRELVVALGREALLWDPVTGSHTTIAHAAPGETIHGADHFAGGVVVWSSRDGASLAAANGRRAPLEIPAL